MSRVRRALRMIHDDVIEGQTHERRAKTNSREGGCLSDGAGVALAEKVAPRRDVWMLLEQSRALALRHAAPDPELDLVVERLRPALVRHRAVPADHRSLTLGRPPHKQFVGIFIQTQRL